MIFLSFFSGNLPSLFHSLLSKVKCLKIFTTRAVSTKYKAIKFLLLQIFSTFMTVLLNKFFYSQVSTTYSNDDLITFYLHEHSFLSIFINTFLFSYKLHIISGCSWCTIYILSQFLINGIISNWMINKHCIIFILL
jgi:hypothetical protein